MREADDTGADEAVLARVAAKDISAMRSLYTAHSEDVLRYVKSRIQDDFEAADIVHDTMLAVWRSAGNFQRRSSVRTWIISIAHNKTVDRIRKQARVVVEEPDETIPSGEPDVETVISATQNAAMVRACVEELSSAHRQTVHLAFYEDMTCAEIAEVEQVPVGTVKTRIYHAKKLIMHCLERCSK